jgi:hypothetical protein
MKQIRDYCGVDMMLRTVDVRGNWFTLAADGTKSYLLKRGNWKWDLLPASQWSRFAVILYPPSTLWIEGPTIGDAELWGGAIGTSGYTIGTTATPEQVATIRAIVKEWKPAGTLCLSIIIAFDPDSFDPASLPLSSGMPDGTWDIGTSMQSGARRPSRLSTARYWDGV